VNQLVERLAALAQGDFDDAAADSAARRSKLRLVVFAVAFSLLMLELVLARMFPFFLGNISSFVAIPVAMFGLSVGALVLHWVRGEPSPRWIPTLLPALLLLTFLSFLLLFFLFNHVEAFGLTHHKLQNPAHDALKTAVFSLLFVPSFALGGVVLSTAFTAGARQVGSLYALDLIGSALACLIAPVVLHFVDLPVAITVLLAVLALACVFVLSGIRRTLAVQLGVAIGIIGLLGSAQLIFTESPDPEVIGVRYARGRGVKELRHQWNDVSRVALMQCGEDDADNRSFRLIHDDGISNVIVRKYKERRIDRKQNYRHPQAFPFLTDPPARTALVMFAGAGQDMMRMLEYSRGTVDVTGVELNGLVPRLVSGPLYTRWNLSEFYDRDDVHLVIDEGRAFLNRDTSKYDAIFVASNGAQHANRTGHSRKYLDTVEAMEAYLDHLSEDGILVFNEQPRVHKIEIFKRLLAERGLASYEDAAMILGRYRWSPFNRVDTIVLKPSGWKRGEVDRIMERWMRWDDRRVHYAPFQTGNVPNLERIVQAPVDPTAYVPTDDRPYERGIQWDRLVLRPDSDEWKDLEFAMDWTKVFTMALFGGLSLLVILLFYVRARGPRRLPLWLTGYFLATGICYMLAQIGLMAKLELFMGFPLYAIAVVLASFLLFNGLGSALVGRYQAQGRVLPVFVPALGAAAALPLTLLIVDSVLLQLLGLPVVLKAPLALLAVAPLAFVLGMFYPLGVGLAVRRDLQTLVPMTFGLATLSSVLGSTWAMIAVLDHGFRDVILAGEAGYLGLAALSAIGLLIARR